MEIRFLAAIRRWGGPLLLAGAGVVASAPAQALTFTNTFDGTWQSGLTPAVTNAESYLSSIFANNVNLNITFSYGSGPLGGAYSNVTLLNSQSYGYAAVKTDVQNAATASPQNSVLNSVVSHLPGSASTPTTFVIPNADALALGLLGSYSNSVGTVTVGNGSLWDTDPTNGITGGTGDLTGVMLHEITHVMGRVDYAFAGNTFPYLTPLDLSRYTIGGNTFNFSATKAGFSIDGGAHTLDSYSAVSDTGDWGCSVLSGCNSSNDLSIAGDANNAYFNYGQLLSFAPVDVQVMEAIGWNTAAPVPEPESYAMLLAGLGLLGFMARCRKQRETAAA